MTVRLLFEVAEKFVFSYLKAAWLTSFIVISFVFFLEELNKNSDGVGGALFVIFATPFVGAFFSALCFPFIFVIAYPSLIIGYLVSFFLIVANVRTLWWWIGCALLTGVFNWCFLRWPPSSIGSTMPSLLLFLIAGLYCGYLMWKSSLKLTNDPEIVIARRP